MLGIGLGLTGIAVLGRGAANPTLSTLTLSASSLTEGSVAGTVVGAVQGKTAASTLTLTDSAGNRFALSGGNIVAGSVATDYETATSHTITIRETLDGATNTPRDSVIAITVEEAVIPVPANTVAPAITGDLVDGETVSLSAGTWTPAPDEVERQWLADAAPAGSGPTLDLTGREGEDIQAQTRARLTGGAWSAWEAATGGGVVAAASAAPVITSPGYIDGQPVVGQAIAVAEPDVTGATSTTYQWYDGDPAGSGVAISGWTGASPVPTGTQYDLTAPIWRRATYTNASGSVTEDLAAPGLVAAIFEEDFSGWTVGDDTTDLLAGGWDRMSDSGVLNWTASIVTLAGGPSGKALDFSAPASASNGGFRSDIDAFFGAHGHQTRLQVLALVQATNVGRNAVRGKTGSAVVSVPVGEIAGGCNFRVTIPNATVTGESINNTLATGALPATTANELYFLRLEYEGNFVKVKLWLASTPEPVAWSFVKDGGAPQVTRGPVFFARVTPGNMRCLYFSAAGHTDAPYWPGYVPPAENVSDPMDFSAASSTSSVSYADGAMVINLEDV